MRTIAASRDARSSTQQQEYRSGGVWGHARKRESLSVCARGMRA